MGNELRDDPIIGTSRKMKRADNGKFYFEADEFRSETCAALSMVTKASTTVFTHTDGKKFHLRYVAITNRAAKAVTWTVNYAPAGSAVTAIFKIPLKSATTALCYKEFTNIQGITTTGNITAEKNTALTGFITVGGILEAEDDGY